MPRPPSTSPKKSGDGNDSHDASDNSMLAMLEVQAEGDSPYPAGQGVHTDEAGYLADPEFRLRGGYDNLMLDAAAQLFGLVIRLRTLDELPNIAFVHQRVQTQIHAIREEMQHHGYPPMHLEAYSYALCLYIDEAVMSRPWGNNSCWSQEPLLSIFHDETHGGEKIFLLLERIMLSPKEFQDVLELLYFCLCLGLRGKYALDPKGDEIINALITRMHKAIRELRGPTPGQLCDPAINVADRPYRRPRRYWPGWSPLVISAIAMACAYCYYSYRLSLTTAEVLQSLDSIMSRP
ncbi:type IVB secretion system protein IcmH/DotU [Pseudomonas sp. NPDC089408]|uniref:type IVB secretion system protein IcmH/DotU n=1 Tax=Pseudomonas sp. NPDC089408 TaxID=3364465 RepID=UPI00381E1628